MLMSFRFVLFNGMALSVVYSLLVPLSSALGVTGTFCSTRNYHHHHISSLTSHLPISHRQLTCDNKSRGSERRHWVHVSTPGMEPIALAAIRTAIRQEVNISTVHGRHGSKFQLQS